MKPSNIDEKPFIVPKDRTRSLLIDGGMQWVQGTPSVYEQWVIVPSSSEHASSSLPDDPTQGDPSLENHCTSLQLYFEHGSISDYGYENIMYPYPPSSTQRPPHLGICRKSYSHKRYSFDHSYSPMKLPTAFFERLFCELGQSNTEGFSLDLGTSYLERETFGVNLRSLEDMFGAEERFQSDLLRRQLFDILSKFSLQVKRTRIMKPCDIDIVCVDFRGSPYITDTRCNTYDRFLPEDNIRIELPIHRCIREVRSSEGGSEYTYYCRCTNQYTTMKSDASTSKEIFKKDK
jgi:hypothetical protein